LPRLLTSDRHTVAARGIDGHGTRKSVVKITSAVLRGASESATAEFAAAADRARGWRGRAASHRRRR
jgi:hypothetical protein